MKEYGYDMGREYGAGAPVANYEPIERVVGDFERSFIAAVNKSRVGELLWRLQRADEVAYEDVLSKLEASLSGYNIAFLLDEPDSQFKANLETLIEEMIVEKAGEPVQLLRASEAYIKLPRRINSILP